VTAADAAVTFSAEHRDGVVVLRLVGELDMSSAPDLVDRVAGLVVGGDPRVLADLAGLSFCDSAGLNAFIRGDRRCAAAGGWLRLTGARGHVARMIELSGLTEVLAYRPDGAP
jgi:anti-sigma B factor antagonist